MLLFHAGERMASRHRTLDIIGSDAFNTAYSARFHSIVPAQLKTKL